jgi:hypothetical protein
MEAPSEEHGPLPLDDPLNTGNAVCPLYIKKGILDKAKNVTALAACARVTVTG